MRLFGLLPLRNIAVFSAFEGKTYGDNPRAVYEEMIRRNLPLKYVWLMRDKDQKVPGAITVKPNSVRGAYYLSVACLWVDCTRKSEWVIKRDNQFYLQTWHGDVALKRIEEDAIDGLSRQYVNAAIHDSKQVDLMISGSTFGTQLFRRAFWYKGEVLELGTPKSDSLFADKYEVRAKIKEAFGIPANSKIVLYLPTFRSDGSTKAYFDDFDGLIQVLNKKTMGDWVAIRKLHPNVAAVRAGDEGNNQTVIDAGPVHSTNELIAASDLVITDYSSCMFDALEIGIPTILFASDLDDYGKERGFYFDFRDMPFPIAHTNDELERAISSFDLGEYVESATVFRDSIGFINDGKASERVVNELLSRINVHPKK